MLILQGYENSQTPVQMLAASAESVVPAAGNATSIEIDPNNRPPDAYSVAVYATPQMQRSPNNCCITPSESFVSVAQPLTPVSPLLLLTYGPGVLFEIPSGNKFSYR
ncbi:unnamed protein product [Toxocara canis]|uniref:Uncharacterized protein n=1 Tax=Toxocara canis TaxID=6265 RepID=A0A183U940_TOXCA|nr:unnamed protein product [Toxocara canis]